MMSKQRYGNPNIKLASVSQETNNTTTYDVKISLDPEKRLTSY